MKYNVGVRTQHRLMATACACSYIWLEMTVDCASCHKSLSSTIGYLSQPDMSIFIIHNNFRYRYYIDIDYCCIDLCFCVSSCIQRPDHR
jgi:hypothetical protein